jgi:penicillin-binding protein 1A
VTHPSAALARRNLVLRNMFEQHRLSAAEYRSDIQALLPARVEPPREQAPTPATPYFTTWVRQQVADRYGAQRAFEGGLRVRTTLDLDFQKAAEKAIAGRLPYAGGPTASLVAIDNATGEVRAMVGGRDYNHQAFNLATQGQRQPGSAFKPFTLAQALRAGIGPGSVWPSRKRVFSVPGSTEKFTVNNYESAYQGSTTLARATATSDNSVYATVGIQVGTSKIARLAERMGIRTPVSHNYAITLGGLKQGVTPLDMAHAYETLATGGRRVTGTLGAREDGPVGIREIDAPKGRGGKMEPLATNKRRRVRVLAQPIADETAALLTSVVTAGTGRRAAVPGLVIAGKTGTTENYGDAWFVGFTRRYTVAVWVGYPNKLRSMTTEYSGQAVAGGTYPAEIFHDFMTEVQAVEKTRAAALALQEGRPPPTDTTETLPAAPSAPSVQPGTPSTTATPPPIAPATPPPSSSTTPPTPNASPTTPQQPTPQPGPAPQQSPSQPPPDSGGASPGAATPAPGN